MQGSGVTGGGAQEVREERGDRRGVEKAGRGEIRL